MLQTVDVLIGFSMVMLVLSVVVTMLVQFVVSMLLNLKGRVLKDGVAHLLNLLDKDNLTADETQRIAHHLLTNTLVARKRVFGRFIGKEFALAQTIHREELIKLVLDFAGNGDLEKASALAKEEATQSERSKILNQKEKDKKLTQDEKSELEGMRQRIAAIGFDDDGLLRARLLNSLRANGIVGDPKEIIKSIRNTMLILEKERPELATDVRQTMATVRHAQSEFVAKVNGWFDQTIDRTIESFTGKTRAWTTLFAAVVALFFQVDTFELLQRLSVDKQARQTLVSAAVEHPEQFAVLVAQRERDEASNTVTDARKSVAAATDDTDRAKSAQALADARRRLAAAQTAVANPAFLAKPSPGDVIDAMQSDPDLQKLIKADLIAWPESAKAWSKGWPREPYGGLAHLIGILVTLGLLTLGAPVWYEILKNLIQFRSLVARKDDVIRAARQTSQKPAG